jgi:hypothetical protein
LRTVRARAGPAAAARWRVSCSVTADSQHEVDLMPKAQDKPEHSAPAGDVFEPLIDRTMSGGPGGRGSSGEEDDNDLDIEADESDDEEIDDDDEE